MLSTTIKENLNQSRISTVKKISSYKYQVVGHNASGFDNHIVLNSLPKPYTSVKIIKTSRRLIKLSSRAGSLWEDDRETPKYAKFVCSKCHISGSLKEIRKEYNIQPQLLKREIEHDLITLSKYKRTSKSMETLLD